MNQLERILWYIESHFGRDLTLDEIAGFAGISRFQLSRAFGAALGLSVMGYVRGRRLSTSARTLAAGAPDILAVAFDANYGSHEAFTRAFRDQFGLTPEQVRDQGTLANIKLVEPINMDQVKFVKLEPPRFVDGKAMLLAGLSGHYTFETRRGIPSLWQKFGPYFGNISGQVGMIGYGLVSGMSDDGFDYLAAVEVSGTAGLPKEITVKRVPARTYAVFYHRDHVSSLGATCAAIWNTWLPESGMDFAGEAPDFFERYGEEFDPVTGLGGCEVWVPVRA